MLRRNSVLVVAGGKVYRQADVFEGTKFHVYDFDNTLFRSPEKPAWWTEKTWWTNAASLEPPCIPEHPKSSWWGAQVVSVARQSIKDKDTYTALITGRVKDTFSTRITQLLLDNDDLRFDELHFKEVPDEDTAEYKTRHILSIAEKFPSITSISIWEDRTEDLDKIAEKLKKKGSYKVEKHLVTKTRSKEVECGSQEEYEKFKGKVEGE